MVAGLGTAAIFITRGAGESDPSLVGSSQTSESPAGAAPRSFDHPPPAASAAGQTWSLTLTTSAGEVQTSLDGAAAPQATSSFVFLADEGFFDGTECHRLLPGSLLQCGDPTGTGTGGPGYQFGPIENAPEAGEYPAGTVAMARVAADGASMGSQFFLVFHDVSLPPDSAGGYTVMGSVTSGLELLQNIAEAGTVDGSMDGRPLTRVIIESVEVT